MLSNLELTNFRNWSSLKLRLAERNLLIGPNGSGKTNIIEAIYLAAVTRSWRTKSDRDLVSWDQEVARVVADDIEIAIAREPYLKKITVDGLEKKATEAIGKILVVLFEPRSINLIFGPPAGRRRFLDVLLAQVSRDYAKALVEIQLVLRQRNALLRRIAFGTSNPSEAKFWNSELIRLSEIIWPARQDFFTSTQEIFRQSYLELTQEDQATIKYRPSLFDQDYTQVLEDHWQTDLEQGSTTIGPHRDDFTFTLAGHDALEIASQGEARSLVLALKKTEIYYLSTTKGLDPILLLDDVFSELDANRRQRLESIIDRHQTIITATDRSYLDPSLQESFTVVDIISLQ